MSKAPCRYASETQVSSEIGKAHMTTILVWLFNEMYTNAQIIFP